MNLEGVFEVSLGSKIGSWKHLGTQKRLMMRFSSLRNSFLDHFGSPKEVKTEKNRSQSDFICLTDLEQKLCLLEKAKIVILHGRGVQNQHLQFVCVWYNGFSKNVIFDECIIVFEGFWAVFSVRVTHFWTLWRLQRGQNQLKIGSRRGLEAPEWFHISS